MRWRYAALACFLAPAHADYNPLWTTPTDVQTMMNAAVPGLAPVQSVNGATGAVKTFICSNSSIPAGNTVSATTTETAFATSCAIPANTFSASRQAVTCDVYGLLSVSATIPTLQGRVKLNGTTVLDTTAVPGLVAGTNFQWRARFSFLALAFGTTGTIDAQGALQAQIGTTNELPIPVRNTSAYTIDTTGVITVSLSAQWGNAMPANSIQLRQIICK